MEGIVTNFNEEKGYGFIRSDEAQEDIFIHISKLKNASSLEQGQEVEFQVKKTNRGLSAINVVAGSKQKSPYFIFGLISAILIAVTGGFLYFKQQIHPLIAYLIAINLTTFLLYGYDKWISSGEALRVPEYNLHALALLGGSPAGLLAQKFFRHKTIKGSFQLIYWFIVVLQMVLLYLFKIS
jgi:uncharacterized membrane protein YsdA (DUF1294 family)/cold shock CspA family protein